MPACAHAQANPYNMLETKVIRDLNPEDVEHLVSVSGMVTRCSTIIPEVKCGTHAPGCYSAVLHRTQCVS